LFRSIQWRIAGLYILLVVMSMGILGTYLANSARNTRLDDLRLHLEREAKITAEAALPVLIDDGSDPDAMAKRLGQDIGGRVTIIALDGTVVGDTDEDPSMMENHATRPEVRAALTSGLGEITRFSTTLGEQMMYVAVPIVNQGKAIGVARVALSLTSVERTVGHVTLTMVLAIVVTAVLAVIAAALLARLTTRPIREVTAASRRIALGEVGQKIPIRSRDETGQLAQAFNDMSTKLNELVGGVSTERTRLATVLSNMTDAIMMTDTDGVAVLANPAAERLFGFRESDIINRPVIETVRDHEVDAVLKSCLRTHRLQTVQFESSISKRFVRAVAVPINEPQLKGALLLFQDLTELRSLQTMRRELIGNISHDLRTPIAGIKAMAETLKDGAIDDRQTAVDFLARIDAEVDRLAQMVSELTELSHIETGQAHLRLMPLNLNVLVAEVIAQLSPIAERQGVTVTTNLEDSLPAGRADRDRIRQTLANLSHTAIKFNQPGGKVVVSTHSNQQAVTVSVSDTGIGISKEDLPHVFERFYKADRARAKGGSGLGLAIAKHTVQAHGGSIWAQSEEGKGSTFTFILPLGQDRGTQNLTTP
jgi:two-component system phosphate regulon sensor histidine kinase PhoR